MHTAAEALFQYTRALVTEQDIIDFSPGDPGYGDYVKAWSKIKRKGVIPTDCSFEVTEVIALTGWGKAEKEKSPDRFRAYRRFTTAVALALFSEGNDSDCIRPAGYVARDLLIDLDEQSARHVALCRNVVMPIRNVLKSNEGENDYPFFTFARMIMAQVTEDWPDAHEAATLLLEDERTVRETFDWLVRDHRFLLGISNYDQVNTDWLSFARRLRNPQEHEDTQRVIDAFASQR